MTSRDYKVFTSIAILSLITVLFACVNIDNPGLYYDEMLFANAAKFGSTNTFIQSRVLGIPIFLMDYIGALKAWIYSPVFALYPITELTLRLPALLIGVTGAALLLASTYILFGVTALILAAPIVLLDPAILMHSRLDWGPNALMFFFRGSLLLSIALWYKTNKSGWAWVTVISIGLGCFDKLNFLWLAYSACLAVVICFREELLLFYRNSKAKSLLLGSVLMLIMTVATVKAVYISSSMGGEFNFALRMYQAKILLLNTFIGSGVKEFIAGNGMSIAKYTIPVYSILSFMTVFALMKWKHIFSKEIKFLLLFLVFTTSFFFVTSTATGPHHAAVVAGLPQILFAAIMSTSYKCFNAPGWYRVIIGGVVLIATILFVSSNFHIIDSMSRPINSNWDKANSEIANIVKNNPNEDFIITDWGIGTQLIALTNGRIYDHWPSFTKAESAVNIVKNLDCNRNTFFVNRLNDFENFKGNRANIIYSLKIQKIMYEKKYTISNFNHIPMIELLMVPATCN